MHRSMAWGSFCLPCDNNRRRRFSAIAHRGLGKEALRIDGAFEHVELPRLEVAKTARRPMAIIEYYKLRAEGAVNLDEVFQTRTIVQYVLDAQPERGLPKPIQPRNGSIRESRPRNHHGVPGVFLRLLDTEDRDAAFPLTHSRLVMRCERQFVS